MKAILLKTNGHIKPIDMKEDADFRWYAKQIGCDWIEIVRPVNCPYVLIVDEEGMMKANSLNILASDMYGTFEHNQPIVGDCLLVREEYIGEPTVVGFDDDEADEIVSKLWSDFWELYHSERLEKYIKGNET